MSLINIAQRAIARNGRPATLRRVAGAPPNQTTTDVAVRAVVRGYTPVDLPQGLPQGSMEARISNAEIAAAGWPGPPRKGDRFILADRAGVVQACDTRSIGEDIALHVLTVAAG